MTSKQMLKLKEMKEIAKERNLKCLSKTYVDSGTHLKLKCPLGHIWEITPSNLRVGKGCPYCAGRYQTIDDMHKIAIDNNFKCLSKKYINARTHLTWECSQGHIWKATPDNIKRGKGCPHCAGKHQTIDDMHKIAKERNGKCLSKQYITAKTKLKWECSEGHTWNAVPNSIKSGRWCPQCGPFYSEELCRTTFEQLFNKNFPKNKPIWLINSINERMELDGYCKNLKIAFEYNGIQHYELNYYTKTKEELNKRKLDDKLKSKLCKKNGIHLFVITHKNDLLELPKLIKIKSKLMGLNVSNINFKNNIDFNKVYQHKTKLEILQNAAKIKNGKLLSKKHTNTRTKLKWECSEGHVWEASYDGIMHKNTWCPKCAGQNKTIDDAHNIAKARNGKCLSKNYINNRKELKWECSEGHTWNAKPKSIFAGTWCHICGKKRSDDFKRGTIKEMHKIAKERNGKCLSKKYFTAHLKLRWKCSEGHVWEAVPATIKSGTWCPTCSYKKGGVKKRLTIEEMQKIASNKKGNCLSSEYIDANTHLKWECSEGHIWNATPAKIKFGRWCRTCATKNNAGKLRLTIKEMQKIASNKKGNCLSSEYINAHTHLKWECLEGHIWNATPHNIKAGKWCPDCRGTKKLTLHEMHDIAKEKNGICLSKKYTNARTNLKWKCEKGHTWYATPGSIKSGSWCGNCYNIKRKKGIR
jgi:hypothetical protein